MKKLMAFLGIIFCTVSCNPGNSGGVLVCEGMPSIKGKEMYNRKESGKKEKVKTVKKSKEPLLLLRMLTEL
ncbi:MAG: hypothetical protein MUE58_11505 [Chitinophagaceae bacterium]|jgi:hypothetical protein|nr:hypothetical protein [Chitinophagaceae bacterium]